MNHERFSPEQILATRIGIANALDTVLNNWQSGIGPARPSDYPHLFFPQTINGEKGSLHWVYYQDAATEMRDHLEQGRVLICIADTHYPLASFSRGINSQGKLFQVPSLTLPISQLLGASQEYTLAAVHQNFRDLVHATYTFYANNKASDPAYYDGTPAPLSWIKSEI